MSRAPKQAIVYIIDTSPSMDQPYPMPVEGKNKCPPSQSRLSAAKEALEGLIASLMIQSKTNEVGVIVLRTRNTHHHLYKSKLNDEDEKILCSSDEENDDSESDELMYPNITELSPVQRPSIHLLRKIRNIEIAGDEDTDDIPHRSGGFCDGIMLAANAIYKRTNGRKFQRKIILLTDAEREVDIDFDALGETIEGLRDMECQLTVVGLDFKHSAKFETAAAMSMPNAENDDDYAKENANETEDVKANQSKKFPDDNSDDDDEGHTHKSDDEGTQMSMEMEMDNHDAAATDLGTETERQRLAAVKSDNENFLISLTKFTGGSVHAATTIQQILDDTMGKRIPRSVLQKVEFIIAPGLSIPGRMSLSTRKANIPTLKRDALIINDVSGKPKENAIGELMTEEIMNSTTHFDADDPDVEVELIHRANGYSYGSDLIPIGPLDMEGLKLRSLPKVTILGYTDRKAIPISQWMGPTRVLSGDPGSKRASLAVSALSQALYRLKQMAICTYVGRKDADPVMGMLVPLIEDPDLDRLSTGSGNLPNDHGMERVRTKHIESKSANSARHLLFVNFPFIDDVQELNMLPLEDAVGDDSSCAACDDLIDAFMLPSNVLNCTNIPNPAIRSFRKTTIQRAVDPESEEIIGGRTNSFDAMSTPPEMLEKGKDVLSHFRGTFPLEVVDSPSKRKKKKFWSDMD